MATSSSSSSSLSADLIQNGPGSAVVDADATEIDPQDAPEVETLATFRPRREDQYLMSFDLDELDRKVQEKNYQRQIAGLNPLTTAEIHAELVSMFTLTVLNFPQLPSSTTPEESYWAWHHLSDLKAAARAVFNNWSSTDSSIGGGPVRQYVLLAAAHSRCAQNTEDDPVSFPPGGTGYKVIPQPARTGDSGPRKRSYYPRGAIGFRTLAEITEQDLIEAESYPKNSRAYILLRSTLGLDWSNTPCHVRFHLPKRSKMSQVLNASDL
jgi:hypothetical protein